MDKSQSASLVVKLEGKNSIDVKTLINMLTYYSVITKRTNDIIGEGDYKSEIKVKAINKGSFEITFEVITTFLQNLLTMENTLYASTIASGVSAVFELYKRFKGRRVTKEEAAPIVNPYNIVQNADTIINLYNDPTANEALRKSFETAKNDTSVNGITLIADGKPSKTITEEEFGELITPKEHIMREKVIVDSDAMLRIVGLSFNKGDNWKFIYKGSNITTKLSDDGLQRAIDKGASFAKGDALKVELEITQRWSEEYSTYVNYRYKVISVTEHMHRPTQHKLF